jgi:hypothetical protein
LNDAPLSLDDSYATDEDVSLVVSFPGVLDNDSDPDGDTLLAELVDMPEHGTLVFHIDGSFTYTPGTNFAGSDSFTYQTSDGSLESGFAFVRISVNR